jgi:hypothetical protein
MFKGAYTNEFYRTIRDAIHAEVNSWNGKGPQLSGNDIATMWRNIERDETSSRNPDATAFTPQSHSCTTAATRDFISLGNLTAAGANLG